MHKSCAHCQQPFEITQEDLEFYEKVSPIFNGKKYVIPPPTFCPPCRQQRRLAFRNERKLYYRKCDMCTKEIISMYSPDKPYIIYCPQCWYSDKWDAISYGKEFDFSRPFFEQFKELMLEIPRLAINLQKGNENCEYTNLTSHNKNCYLIFAANTNENAFYSTYLQRSNNVLDCFFVSDSELCYECIDCYNCYRTFYSQNCQNCSESYFLYNCKNCTDCFGCVGLMNKKYYIFNQPYEPEEYRQKTAEILSDPQKFKEAQRIFTELKGKNPHKYYDGIQNENISGDHIAFSKNTFDSYDVTSLEDCRYCTWLHNSKNCYDCYAWGISGELGYENHLCGNNFFHVMFSDSCWNDVSELMYCQYCTNNSNNLFGCIGLNKKSYCILNKQCTKEEYECLVPRIIEHMQNTGELGEFFPASISPFAYNETVAQEYFPLNNEEAIQRNFQWKESDLPHRYEGQKIRIPFNISEVPDTFIRQILTCIECNKNYKIISQELELYRKLHTPIPEKCFDCRYKARRQLRNPRKLWQRECIKCKAPIETTYSPERTEKVYCEDCYLKEVY